MPIWRRSLRQTVSRLLSLARTSAGKSKLARIAITAITTNNSMSVNPSLAEKARRLVSPPVAACRLFFILEFMAGSLGITNPRNQFTTRRQNVFWTTAS
jgi:hypothetical protein